MRYCRPWWRFHDWEVVASRTVLEVAMDTSRLLAPFRPDSADGLPAEPPSAGPLLQLWELPHRLQTRVCLRCRYVDDEILRFRMERLVHILAGMRRSRLARQLTAHKSPGFDTGGS